MRAGSIPTSGTNRTDKAVKPTRSQNITVSCRRSASADDGDGRTCVASLGDPANVSAAPHFPQNLAPKRAGAPQDGQNIGADAPHASQNLLPSAMSALQLGHSIAALRCPVRANVTYHPQDAGAGSLLPGW